jgi:hypothetical protein
MDGDVALEVCIILSKSLRKKLRREWRNRRDECSRNGVQAT